MKKRIILLLAALTALLSCSDIGFERDNPWDEGGKKWNGGYWTLTIETTGDCGTVSLPVGANKYYEEISVPVRASADGDCEFTGWTGELNIKDANVTITMNGDKTLTANFQSRTVIPTVQYTVLFNLNGGIGTEPSAQTVDSGYTITLPEQGDLIFDGYTFGGWNTNTDGTGTNYSVGSSYTFDNSITLYAQWTPTYTVTFDANGGTVSPTSDTTGADGRLALLPTPKRTCYTFNGWYTSAVGGETVTANTVFSSDVTVYARWTAISGCTAFTDSRDGKEYRWVQIGDQVWMAENLNFAADGSKCYDNSPDSCAKYGRLYNWSTAMGIDEGYYNWGGSDVKHQGVCPADWHIPSDAEWTTLTDFVGGASTAGTKLKSPQYWNSYSGVPEGTDEFGFAALPGGDGSSDGNFIAAGYNGFWWSATELIANSAWFRLMYYSNGNVYRGLNDKTNLFSVRCVQD
jgi:uncharacterized protein (TIGR02145 family)/uncharacterized repeat protein (TIGR02543 family)